VSEQSSRKWFQIFIAWLISLIDIILNSYEPQKDSAECQQIHLKINNHDEGTHVSMQEFPQIIDWSEDGL